MLNVKSGWLKEDKVDIATKVALFLISPFISFLYSLRRINTKSSFVFFFLFALLYGLCFTVVADTTSIFETSDAARWRYRFENIPIRSFDDYIVFCSEYFRYEGTDVRDIYFGSVSFFVHSFTDNYHVFFFMIALVFSFFQLKSFRFMTSSSSFDNTIVCLFLCALFTRNCIANISGVRYWSAAWICIYGLFQYFYSEKRQYLLLLLCTPLVHRSFFFLYPILLLSTFNNEKVWKYIFFISCVSSSLSTYIIRDATPYLPAFLTYMVEAYTEKSTVEIFSFTKLFLTNIAMIYIDILFFLIILRAKKIMSKNVYRMYQFTLIFISIVNFVMPVPSLGVRFFVIAEALVAFLWLNVMGTRSKYNWLIYLMPLFLVRQFFIEGFSIIRYQEMDFFLKNPFSLIITYL